MKKGKEHLTIVLCFILSPFTSTRNISFNTIYLKIEVLEQSQAGFVAPQIHMFDFIPKV